MSGHRQCCLQCRKGNHKIIVRDRDGLIEKYCRHISCYYSNLRVKVGVTAARSHRMATPHKEFWNVDSRGTRTQVPGDGQLSSDRITTPVHAATDVPEGQLN